MKITTKLISLGLFPIFIVLISACINIYTLYKSNQATQTYLNEYIDRQIRVSEILKYIGYGKGIHNFKNYILRGTDEYRDRFLKNYQEANSLIQKYLLLKNLSEVEQKAMETLLSVNNKYLSILPIADKLIEKNVAVREIDDAVKIDDKPAEKELENLHRYFHAKKLQAIEDLKNTQNKISFQALVVLFFALVISFFTNNRVAKKMLFSITQLGRIAKDVSHGNYDNSKTIEKFPEDELKILGTQLIEMGKVLESTIFSLRRSNEDLEQFAFAASHDLQEPIKKIAMFSDLLQRSTDSKLTKEEGLYLEKIKTFSQEMIELIQSLLNYSKISETAYMDEQIDLNLVIKELSTTTPFSQIKIESQKLPLVTGNRQEIKTVLRELFSNSYKFKKKEANCTLMISYETNEEFITLNLEDNGVGFDNRYKELIFKPFGRAHNKTDYSGVGIGLSIIKKILDAHESTYSFSGEEDKGAVFKFTLKKFDKE